MLKRYLFLVVLLVVLVALAVPVTASSNQACRTWNETVRVRLANNTTGEVLDFAATNFIVDGASTTSIHVVAANNNGHMVNSHNIPLSGRPHDGVRINRNLVAGRIETTVEIYNMQTGDTHVLSIDISTLATPAAHPYTYDSTTGEYIRSTSEVSGRILLDGELWFDVQAGSGLEALAWNISTCAPPSR